MTVPNLPENVKKSTAAAIGAAVGHWAAMWLKGLSFAKRLPSPLVAILDVGLSFGGALAMLAVEQKLRPKARAPPEVKP